ncbi:MAG: aminomethyl-transferring glycine dehydrogenase [Alphaproteobacteria bacterium]|nr:aminomethyl-transferring glycine dehydrogenase [Alphaproteobacteria bacterium]
MAEQRRTLGDLQQRTDFVRRHIGPAEADVAEMLQTVGYPSLDALMDRAVPKSILSKRPMRLQEGQTETEAIAHLQALADQNRVFRSMIGMGYYDTITPPVILRNVLECPGWYTAYTPYQPEISQGRLEALLNFQAMVMDMTGMELANASLLDEATAAAEAMTMCRRVGKSAGQAFFVAEDCHPQTIAVIRTRAAALGIELVIGDPQADLDPSRVFGLLLQYPNTFGEVRDYAALAEQAHAAGALVVVAADLLSLALLKPPGEWGADVVVGSAQRFGVPLGFGGPHAAFFATREAYKRTTPGRLVGVSVDRKGRPGLRLALQTREQHIRREKATSNICTAQVLLANMAGLYAAWHGPDGIRTIAERVHRLTVTLAKGLDKLGFGLAHKAYFDTLAVAAKGKANEIVKRAAAAHINLRLIDPDTVGISLDETTVPEELEAVWRAFTGRKTSPLDAVKLARTGRDAVPSGLRRSSAFLTHPVFNSYHSETEMLRYLRRLQEKDIALDRAMIPLGSCTMKLNATTEMMPITWPKFARIHPYAPLSQAKGYLVLIDELETMLCGITGFDAVSLQPNAGSQGEYSGLLAIRRYHQSRGQGDRRICLIPSSAHGTNPASAIMAGMDVVVVACDKHGNVDIDDLRAKANAHGDRLAALMVTYPSTHGVYEAQIVEICKIVHDHGGQVYMDGANLNALVGYAKPGEFGADVAHLNLHKTFCIPHGGGGPGVGPIGVGKHLAPFLPGHPLGARFKSKGAPVAAAPWGSAGILPISWAYIALMGRDGLKRATEVAILNANYIATRLKRHYPVLYTGPGGLCAHECIIDTRPLKDSAGVDVEDIAKRLIDYGFHAPTMSFPVAGTLMIEPTESESKAELDRFCDAMIAIREEIREIEEGRIDREDNPLKNAPHTADDLVAESWSHPYSRARAVYPVASLRADKYWPPVGRIDNVYGDRHLVCTCPPLEAYQEAAE